MCKALFSTVVLLLGMQAAAVAQTPAPGQPIVIKGVPGLPALPLPLPALPIDPLTVPNPGVPLLPDPIARLDPGALPGELQVPDPLIVLDPGQLPSTVPPGLPPLPGLPAGANEQDVSSAMLEAGALGLPIPSSFELRQALEQHLKQPVRAAVAQGISELPTQTDVPIPADPLAELLQALRSTNAPVQLNTQALETMLANLDQTQLRSALLAEVIDALLQVDPTVTLTALEQIDAQDYLARLAGSLTAENLAASTQTVVAYLQGEPLSGQMPAQLIALLLAVNPLPVDTMGLDPLVLVQIAGNLMLAVASLPDLPVSGLALDANSIRNDVFDAVNPLLAFALALEPAEPAALAQSLEQALIALRGAAAAGLPSLLVPGVVLEAPAAATG